jgi:hypothetical protein
VSEKTDPALKTEERYAEMAEKYGAVPLLFSSYSESRTTQGRRTYYKYSFTFTGIAPDGAVIVGSYGGEAGDIYRDEVKRDDPLFLKDQPFSFCRIRLGEKLLLDYTSGY